MDVIRRYCCLDSYEFHDGANFEHGKDDEFNAEISVDLLN